MRRANGLFDRIVERENLRLAVCRALRGKRQRPDARQFVAQLDKRLSCMAAELRSGTIEVGRMNQFVIRDPKERVITAPLFTERVLHHVIMNICEPELDRWLIPDTYACRRGKGRIAALLRAQEFSTRFAWRLKLDVRKYFDSVSHDRLLALLEQRFKDPPLLRLWERIVRAFRGESGIGLPIGSLTSQHFANFYLGWLDRYVKEQLRIPGYVRYMDDMVLWSDDRDALQTAFQQVKGFLDTKLALSLKGDSGVRRTSVGLNFLGCRVFPAHLRLGRRGRRRFVRKLRQLETSYRSGRLDELELQKRASSLVAFARAGGMSSWRFRRRALEQLAVSGHMARTV
jgi:RNA-directed DNA polymerase